VPFCVPVCAFLRLFLRLMRFEGLDEVLIFGALVADDARLLTTLFEI